MAKQLVDVDYELIIHETADAYYFLIDSKKYWIPKSLAEVDTDAKTVTIPYGIAFDKGLL